MDEGRISECAILTPRERREIQTALRSDDLELRVKAHQMLDAAHIEPMALGRGRPLMCPKCFETAHYYRLTEEGWYAYCAICVSVQLEPADIAS